SHNTNQTALAQFRDLSNVTSGTVGTVLAPTEALAPCSRKTPIVISEIMYKPAPRNDSLNLEYIELFNANPFYEDISGYQLAGDIQFTFPPNTVMGGGAFLVVAKVPADVQGIYGISGVMGPYTSSLNKPK